MRDHEHAESVRTENRRTPAAGAGTPSWGLLALQSSAGNAGVVQMLRRAGHSWERGQHEHDADCGRQAEPPVVQRSAVHDVLRGGGRPLDEATRSDMEARFGTDFSDVRIHNDAAARVSAAEVGARAYTSGSHIVIGEGGTDKHTLAHELTHVIQQRQGPVAGTDNGAGLKVSDPSDRFEREAEVNATRVMARSAPESAPAADGGGVPATGTVQRAIDIGLCVVDGKHKTIDELARWKANVPTFFTFGQSAKRRWGIRNTSDEQRVQGELFATLNRLIDSDERFEAKTADKLRNLVKDTHGKSPAASAATPGPSAAVGASDDSAVQAGARTVLTELTAMGDRAFPRDEIQSLARKAVPGSGWLYELQMGLMELNEDPQCVVQFGACSRDDINHYLGRASGAEGGGNHIAAYEPDKRSGNVGADWVIWRPVAPGGDTSARAQAADMYTGEFVQAKQTVERNFAANLKAAAFQLEGKNASGQGNATTQPELTLRSEPGSANRHRGTIAMQVTDDIRDVRKVENAIEKELRGPGSRNPRNYVDRVVLEEAAAGGKRTVYELSNGRMVKTTVPATRTQSAATDQR
ncbi:eCIS core domain-containing protein [Streptomyces sp. NPDC004096]|uniref:eCIS core domain-containing protein n=1 Tax=unclassified Streptomyces TaxID=2593676 RepID=UPI0033A6C664